MFHDGWAHSKYYAYMHTHLNDWIIDSASFLFLSGAIKDSEDLNHIRKFANPWTEPPLPSWPINDKTNQTLFVIWMVYIFFLNLRSCMNPRTVLVAEEKRGVYFSRDHSLPYPATTVPLCQTSAVPGLTYQRPLISGTPYMPFQATSKFPLH